MRILVQIAIMFGICIISSVISSILPITVPTSVVSMILLFILLLCGILKTAHIDSLSQFLLDHMAFFFVPAGVGLIESFSLFSDKLFKLIAVCTINTVLTFLVTAFTVTLVANIIDRRKKS